MWRNAASYALQLHRWYTFGDGIIRWQMWFVYIAFFFFMTLYLSISRISFLYNFASNKVSRVVVIFLHFLVYYRCLVVQENLSVLIMTRGTSLTSAVQLCKKSSWKKNEGGVRFVTMRFIRVTSRRKHYICSPCRARRLR